jgi:hypothetical protein
MRRTLPFFLVVAAVLATAHPALAQSPDTSTLVVVVEDPQGPWCRKRQWPSPIPRRE